MILMFKTFSLLLCFMGLMTFADTDMPPPESLPVESSTEMTPSSASEVLNPQFSDGLKAYQAKRFSEAQKVFEMLLKDHPNNPHLLFNLGLSEYQTGRVGFALGFWRKALFIAPRFKPASAAIEFVEAKLFPQTSSPSFIVTLFNSLNRISFHLWMGLCFITFIFLSWMAIDWGAQKKKPFLQWPVRFYILIPVFLFSAILASTTYIKSLKIVATVAFKNQMSYVSPSEDSPTLTELTEGQILFVEKFHENWAQIKTPSGAQGWIPRSALIVARGDI